DPTYLLIVFALAGESTMTQSYPPPPTVLRRGAVLVTPVAAGFFGAAFLRPVAAGVTASVGVFFRAGTAIPQVRGAIQRVQGEGTYLASPPIIREASRRGCCRLRSRYNRLIGSKPSIHPFYTVAH